MLTLNRITSFQSFFLQKRNKASLFLSPKEFKINSSRALINTHLFSTTTESNEDIEIYKNKNNIKDQVFSAISGCGGVKVTAVTARNLINDWIMTHSMAPVPADALGRSMLCGLMLSNGMQVEQTFQLTIKGDGPLRGVCIICTGAGETRGYVGNAALNGFNLQEAVGQGTVQVVKNHPDWPRPFNGITAIRNSDIDRDVGIYLAESEQRSCALAAATKIDGNLCKAAGGYMVEQLPGVEPEVIKRIEENLMTLVEKDGGDTIPTNLLREGLTPLDIAQHILEGLDMKPLQQITPSIKCPCSEERLLRAIRLLPKDEVNDIIEENNGIEARCHFCGTEYKMSAEVVKEKLASAKGDPSLDADVGL